MTRKKLMAVLLSVVLITSSVPPREVEASWFSDLLGGFFTILTSPIQVFCPDNPTFRKNNPWRSKAWEEANETFVYPNKEKKEDKFLPPRLPVRKIELKKCTELVDPHPSKPIKAVIKPEYIDTSKLPKHIPFILPSNETVIPQEDTETTPTTSHIPNSRTPSDEEIEEISDRINALTRRLINIYNDALNPITRVLVATVEEVRREEKARLERAYEARPYAPGQASDYNEELKKQAEVLGKEYLESWDRDQREYEKADQQERVRLADRARPYAPGQASDYNEELKKQAEVLGKEYLESWDRDQREYEKADKEQSRQALLRMQDVYRKAYDEGRELTSAEREKLQYLCDDLSKDDFENFMAVKAKVKKAFKSVNASEAGEVRKSMKFRNALVAEIVRILLLLVGSVSVAVIFLTMCGVFSIEVGQLSVIVASLAAMLDYCTRSDPPQFFHY